MMHGQKNRKATLWVCVGLLVGLGCNPLSAETALIESLDKALVVAEAESLDTSNGENRSEKSLALESKRHDNKRKDIALKHVMFEQFQGRFDAAYKTAEYYRQRNVAGSEIKLVQAAASLELGFLELGRDIISDLDERSLLPENQSRLRLYLARDAYRRRDWPLLETHLSRLQKIDHQRAAFATNLAVFLKAELARSQGNYSESRRHLNSLKKESKLRAYGQFNLAVDIVQYKPVEQEQALQLLTNLVSERAGGSEQALIQDRARVALAEIYLAEGQDELARGALSKVSVLDQFGPNALAQVARLDMEAKRYPNAAAIWQYLIEQYPWHVASQHAISGLGYALLKTSGEEAAFAVYSDGLDAIEQHQSRLSRFQGMLDDTFVHSDNVANADDELLQWLSEGFGHDDWLSWLSRRDTQEAAQRWHMLSGAYASLETHRDSLEQLRIVDAEQQRRANTINQTVSEAHLDRQLQNIARTLEVSKQRLARTRIGYTDDLVPFAAPDQLVLINDLEDLKRRVGQPLRGDLKKRMDRLLGVVRFEVFRNLPHQKQKMIQALDRQLVVAANAKARVQRIQAAVLHQPNSVSQRVKMLARRSEQLEQRTQLALRESRQELLTSISELIQQDQASLQVQLAGIQYDVTRLLDRRVAKGSAP